MTREEAIVEAQAGCIREERPSPNGLTNCCICQHDLDRDKIMGIVGKVVAGEPTQWVCRKCVEKWQNVPKKPTNDTPFKAGDVVCLRSGSPSITVNDVVYREGKSMVVGVTWDYVERKTVDVCLPWHLLKLDNSQGA